MEHKDAVGVDGRRLSLDLTINRVNSFSPLPSISLVNKVACIDHCAARVAETLIQLTLTTVVQRKDVSSEDTLARADKFCQNLSARDVFQVDSRADIIDGKLKVMSAAFEI